MKCDDPTLKGREDLLAEVGHELRNPLSSILTFADALQDGVFGPVTDAQKKALGSILECVRRETDLVADLMEWRKLELGVPSLSLSPCRVEEVLAHAATGSAEVLQSRKASLVTEVLPFELMVNADPARLRQIALRLTIAGIRAADVGAPIRLSALSIEGHLHLSVVVAPPGAEPLFGDEATASDPAVEQRLRKLGPIGFSLLQMNLALHGGSLVCQEAPGGCLRLLALLPM